MKTKIYVKKGISDSIKKAEITPAKASRIKRAILDIRDNELSKLQNEKKVVVEEAVTTKGDRVKLYTYKTRRKEEIIFTKRKRNVYIHHILGLNRSDELSLKAVRAEKLDSVF